MGSFSMALARSALIVALLAISGWITSAAAQPIPAGYKLVWSDEFDKDGTPDPAKWSFENGFVRNQENQWYQRENAVCKDGLLLIEARRTHQPNPNYDSSSKDWRKNRPFIEYTSACLKTVGKASWKYGLFEMRGRIDVDPGCWPAWWTLGVERPWPANGEIDIMEYYRNKLLANVACLGPEQRPQWSSKTRPVDSLGGQAWANQFHTWRMYWDEDSITLTMDAIVLNKVSVKDFVDKDGSGFEPFKQPHYMLLNLAIGGQSGGDPQHTSFPRKFEVDYVRVYQKTQ